MQSSSSNGTRRSAILAAPDLRELVIEIPEWNVTVLARGFTGRQRAQFAGAHRGDTPDFQSIYTDILVAGLHDPETKEPLFTADDREALMGKSGEVLERLATTILGLSGLSSTALPEAQKNF